MQICVKWNDNFFFFFRLWIEGKGELVTSRWKIMEFRYVWTRFLVHIKNVQERMLASSLEYKREEKKSTNQTRNLRKSNFGVRTKNEAQLLALGFGTKYKSGDKDHLKRGEIWSSRKNGCKGCCGIWHVGPHTIVYIGYSTREARVNRTRRCVRESWIQLFRDYNASHDHWRECSWLLSSPSLSRLLLS